MAGAGRRAAQSDARRRTPAARAPARARTHSFSASSTKRAEDQQHGGGGDRGAQELAQAGVHLPRQRELFRARDEQRHDEFVERCRKREQCAGGDARRDQRQQHAEERDVRRRAQRRRGLEQVAVEGLQRREHGDEHIGRRQHRVREDEPGQRVVEPDQRKGEVHRGRGHDDRHHHRGREQSDEERLAAEAAEEEAERAQRAEGGGEHGGGDADDEAVLRGEEPLAARKEVLVPAQRIAGHRQREELARR